jgi:hypothetical protein
VGEVEVGVIRYYEKEGVYIHLYRSGRLEVSVGIVGDVWGWRGRLGRGIFNH